MSATTLSRPCDREERVGVDALAREEAPHRVTQFPDLLNELSRSHGPPCRERAQLCRGAIADDSVEHTPVDEALVFGQLEVSGIRKSDGEFGCSRHRPSVFHLGIPSSGQMVDTEGRATNRTNANDISEVGSGSLIEPHATNLPIVLIQSQTCQWTKVPCDVEGLSLQNIAHAPEEVQRVARRTTEWAVKS